MTKYIKFFLLGLFMATFASSCKTNEKEAPTKSVGLSADTLALATKKMHEYVDEGKLAGISTLVVKDGEVVHRDRIGFVDIANKKQVADSSIYRIFSMTKPITAVAMMRLYDEGKIALDDKVSKYIPAFADTQVYAEVDGKHGSEPQGTEMTLRHLMTHTSGIVYGWAESYTDSVYATKNFMGVDRPVLEMAEDLATVPLKFQPGTKWEYGLGIDVAGAVVEVASGQPLDQYFKTTIFDPLGMDDTAFYVPTEKDERLAELYQRTEEGKLEPNEAMRSRNAGTPPKLFLGGAGLVSTIGDYEKFCRMLLNKGTLDGNRILSEQAVQLIMTNQLPEGVAFEEGEGYGLSGSVKLSTGEYAWGGAASTNFWIDPKNDLIVICYTQLFPGDHSYAEEFKEIVDRALVNSK